MKHKLSARFGLHGADGILKFAIVIHDTLDIENRTMKNFRIIPFSREYANKIRKTRKDDFSNDVIEKVAKGYGPCRVSLKPFAIGADVRLLFAHSPFPANNIFNQPGPVFINKEDVEPYSDIYKFPEEIKKDKINFPLTLIGYSKKQNMVFTRLVGNDDVDELIQKTLYEKPYIEFLHARNAEAACFICKIERS